MDEGSKTMLISFFTNIFLSAFKIGIGFLGKSGALIADGIHSISDLATDLVALIGNQLSKKPADKKHPYGHGKIEYITSLLIGVVILSLGMTVIVQAITKKIEVPSILVAIVSFITIFIKGLLASHLIQVGKKEKNTILLASGYESRADVFSSIVVFLSILLMQLTKIIEIFKYADIIAMLLMGVLILKIGFEILKENVSSILGEQETNECYLKKIKKILLETSEIHHIDHLKVLKFGTYYKLDADVSMDPYMTILKSHHYIHEAENDLRQFDPKIWYIHIHVNPDISYSLRKANQQDLKRIQKYRFQSSLKEEKKANWRTEEMKSHLQDYRMILHHKDVIGTIGYYKIEKELYIEEFYIEKRYRYCKIGTRILKEIIQNNPNIPIILWVMKSNSFAISFYKKLGFKEEITEKSRIQMRFSNQKNA